MSLGIADAFAKAENTDDLHLARLLVLLGSADAKKRTEESKKQAVEGITKLAKMDFFLRYPTYLERALVSLLGSKAPDVRLVERERSSIETAMVRFRYGPWDSRYRRWLGLLHARGLATLALHGNTVMIGLTAHGRDLASILRQQSLFADMADRSDAIAKELGKMSATKLKNFTYDVVPEILALKWGDEITP